MPKVKVRNRARGPRGFIIGGRATFIEPGEERELELDDYTGGDCEVVSASIPRVTMKKGP